MTTLLAQRVHKVIAIEIDAALVQQLEQDFRDQSRVQIVRADVLSVDLPALCRREGIARGFIFGNLPYYITSPILHHLFAQRQSIRAMGLVMQREVAERVTAGPGNRNYGYLTVATQTFAQARIALIIPAGAFSPAPKVESALVTFRTETQFRTWSEPARKEFLEFVKHCFAQKRKNLLNNLAGVFPRDAVAQALEQTSVPVTSRAEQLSVQDLASIFEKLRRAEERVQPNFEEKPARTWL